ncbi:sulfotransferase [uncultured Umboniibacter sp.]|uniref:sulfotransferase n=1 Tax=uncultured Umboniibacter sp. TaxID=1798917 RepID=UPI00262F6982|nr:sulfotransferase [uncultured Umboniibacter sp.]
MSKNFILGVGCQKGGTTWLHSQLDKSSNVDMGFTKEYHVFDALYEKECRRFLTEKLTATNNRIAFDNISQRPHLFKHLSFYANTQNYYDYFDYLWFRGGETVSLVGDITPSYAALPVTTLEEIKANLERRGFMVKVVFLMRDPLERCWSALRMSRRDKLLSNPDIKLPNEEKELLASISRRKAEIRTRYEVTIERLERVFDEQNIFYGFYEQLFQSDTLNRLREFLDLADFEPDVAFQSNVSKKSQSLRELNEEVATTIVNHYRSTYEYCEKRFHISSLWSGWKYL